jgi:CheY-like chemotaxis protein
LFVSETGNVVDRPRHLARVLIAHGELAPRLALQTILEAGGYAVDVAATPSEALAKLDAGEYELVLSDTHFGEDVLAYARVKPYRPATSLITSTDAADQISDRDNPLVAIHTEDLPELLGRVAGLIQVRASRRYRGLRHAV